KPSLKALRRNSKHSFDRRGIFGVTKRGELEQRSDSSKPRIPRPRAVAPMMLEVIEEIADTGGIEVVELQLGWFRAMPRGGEDQHQPQGIPIGRERMRAGLPLPDQAVA